MTPRPLRIAVVSEHASPLAVLGGPDSGGQNVHVRELSRHLAELGAEITIHTRRDDPALPARLRLGPGVVVHHVDAGPAAPVARDELAPLMDAFAARLVEDWTAARPDVVHAHYWMSGLAATSAAEAVGLPVALTFHALGLVKRRFLGAADTSPACRIEAELELARTVDLLVATGEDELHELAAAGAVPRQAVVVPCGVDLDRFRPAPPSGSNGECEAGGGPGATGATGATATGRSAPARRPGRHRIVALGRLVERKGIADVLVALTELPDAELVVIGGPPGGLLEDDPVACALLDQAARLGVADRVELLGAVPTEAVPEVLRSADVACHYPWYEAFGMAALEAMACGVPVVASATGGLAGIVEDGVTGLLVAPRRPEELAEALRTLLDDPARRAEMGRQGAMRAVRYSWRAVAAEVYGQLHALARRTGPPRPPEVPGGAEVTR